jgi:hypothetical protein
MYGRKVKSFFRPLLFTKLSFSPRSLCFFIDTKTIKEATKQFVRSKTEARPYEDYSKQRLMCSHASHTGQ